MKTRYRLIRFFLPSLLMAGLLSECKKNDDHPAPALQPGCQLLGVETYLPLHTSGPGRPFTEETKNYYSMDNRGFVKEENDWTLDKYENNSSSSAATISNVVVDQNGYLTATTNEATKIDTNGVKVKTLMKISYSYDHGRLVKQTVGITTGSVSKDYVYLYAYDGSGKLIKYTKPTSTVSYTYSDDKLSQAVLTNAAGVATTETIEVDDQGRLTKVAGPSQETRYTYDSEGSLTRIEFWAGGKPQYGDIYEYDHGTNPMNRIYFPAYKGYPNQAYLFLFPVINSSHNLVKHTQLQTNPSGSGLVPYDFDVYFSQYNAGNYQIKTTDSLYDANGKSAAALGTSYFIYTGCH